MKAFYKKVLTESCNSFEFKNIQTEKFDESYHYHNELEIVLIIKGSGKKIIGDSISSFHDGTLILLGENLAHCWKSNKEKSFTFKPDQIIQIHFSKDFLGKDFFNIPEMKSIKNILKSAERGLEIFGESKTKITEKILNLRDTNGSCNIIELLSILNILANSSEYSVISRSGYFPEYNINNDKDRLGKVFTYIYENYNKNINLEHAASLVFLSKSAFCHFFYKRTGKNFSTVINEIRIENACKQLTETDMSISEICYENGYNSISNFNKQFKYINKTTPLKYRKTFSFAIEPV